LCVIDTVKVVTVLFFADMDGFKLLEAIGLELDLPVISEPQQLQNT
jgi:hypothetical protein